MGSTAMTPISPNTSASAPLAHHSPTVAALTSSTYTCTPLMRSCAACGAARHRAGLALRRRARGSGHATSRARGRASLRDAPMKAWTNSCDRFFSEQNIHKPTSFKSSWHARRPRSAACAQGTRRRPLGRGRRGRASESGSRRTSLTSRPGRYTSSSSAQQATLPRHAIGSAIAIQASHDGCVPPRPISCGRPARTRSMLGAHDTMSRILGRTGRRAGWWCSRPSGPPCADASAAACVGVWGRAGGPGAGQSTPRPRLGVARCCRLYGSAQLYAGAGNMCMLPLQAYLTPHTRVSAAAPGWRRCSGGC